VKTPRQAGFTLIELIVVMSILSVLAAIALPRFEVTVIRAREAVLLENLFQLRDRLDQYQLDQGRYPGSLDDLVEAGYLREIPKDPITQMSEWTTVAAEPDDDLGGDSGVFDVHSTSEELGLNGVPYSEW
jgi:general secretion pathway protein G